MFAGSSASGLNGPQGVPLVPPPAPDGPPPAGVGVLPSQPPQVPASHQWWAQAPVPDPVAAPLKGSTVVGKLCVSAFKEITDSNSFVS